MRGEVGAHAEVLAEPEREVGVGAAVDAEDEGIVEHLVRAQLFEYQFADPKTHAQTGQWWMRRPRGLYFPELSLAEFSQGPEPHVQPPAEVWGGGR